MTTHIIPADRAPGWVKAFGPIATRLLNARVPLGFNRLLTVRGRKSGRSHTTPLAVIERDGRRWVWAPWGEVNWVRNLRAARTATITIGSRDVTVRADELDEGQRVTFFRDILRPIARRIPFGVAFIRIIDGVDLDDPTEAARGRPVFELRDRSVSEKPSRSDDP